MDYLTFALWEALAGVMIAKRHELLRHLHRAPRPTSASPTPRRDYRRLHEDAEALVAAGLL